MHPSSHPALACLLTWVALLAVGCGDDDADDDLDPAPDAADVADAGDAVEGSGTCVDYDPLRNLYFGDLHIHTSLSFDAWINDVRSTPDDAYLFAQGQPLALPPLDADGNGTRIVQLDRPLDFAAVTDHAEYLAEIDACTNPGNAAYDTPTCVGYRNADDGQTVRFGSNLTATAPTRFADICGAIDCAERATGVWGRVVDAAARHDDDSDACTFSTLVGYEWTGATGISNFHRNVLFRGLDGVPTPVSYFEEPTPEGLWRALDESGVSGVLAVPHNANMSDGQMFHPSLWDDLDAPTEDAERRARIERLLEIIQHKGDGECMNGLAANIGGVDELCDFEKLDPPPIRDCGDEPGVGGMAGVGCASPYDYLRGILTGGLALRDALGVNPYRLGVVGGTDTHNATAGLADEGTYPGHVGSDEATPEQRLARPGLLPGGVRLNPGGLTAVWAEENTREAIFDALYRRETYATSGPRLRVRFFGARGWSTDLCAAGDAMERADAEGVPMGGVLPDGDAAPTFFVLAAQDVPTPDRPAVGLERVQIIKGWRDADGTPHERVFEVAASDATGALDLQTCAAGGGDATLCATWTDPTWSRDQDAWYYARVVEVPTCRWSHVTCLALAESERPPSCEDPLVPDAVRERAVTSPIWTR